MDFYPSITRRNIQDAIKFAKKYSNISDKDINIIYHSCETLLIYNGEPWQKQGNDSFFDVPMGSFYGAELCELIGLYILSNINEIFATGQYGLYRDDGLAIVQSRKVCNIVKIEASIKNKLKKLGFNITVEAGATATDFLDVFLDLKRNIYHPFKKPNSKTRYIDKRSNHPSHITKAIPRMVHQRLCLLSKNQDAFINHSSDYIDQLKLSGYDTKKLSYQTVSITPKKRRKRNVIYFHPPFCKSVRTNISRMFRKLVIKHFTPDHKLSKIFNKNTLKVSYSCLPNIKATIAAHNKKILSSYTEKPLERLCNCRNSVCPLDGICLKNNVIYKAEVSMPAMSTPNTVYIGSTSQIFTKRYYQHVVSFKNKNLANSTTLSRFIHKLKEKTIDYNIKWSIIYQSHQSSKNLKFCSLCNLEKLAIALAKRSTLLNNRNELVARCMHSISKYF